MLGPTEVATDEHRVLLPAGRARAVLALLVLHAGEVVSSDRIIDALWGERPPPTAPTIVHGLISRLRTVLEPGRAKGRPSALLPTLASGYLLAIDADDVDANRFTRLVDEAREQRAALRSTTLSVALHLWRG